MAAKTLKTGFWILFFQVSTRVFSFFSFIIIANLLGVALIGKYTYIISLAALLTLFVEFGSNQFVIRAVAGSVANHNKGFYQVIADMVVLKLLQFLVGIFLIVCLERDTLLHHFSMIYFIFLYVLFDGIAQIGISILNGKKLFMKVYLFSFLYENIRTIFIILIFYFFRSIDFLPVPYILMALLYVAFVFMMGTGIAFKWSAVKVYLKKGVRNVKRSYSLTYLFFLSAIAYQLYFKVDVLMLKKLSDSVELGIYSTAYKFFEVFLFFPAILSGLIFPVVVSYFANNNLSGLKKYLLSIQLFATSTIAIAVLIIIFLSKLIIHLFFPPGFEAAGLIMQILFLTSFLYCLNFVYPISLNSSGNEKFGVYIFSLGFIANLSANYIFIPLYGAKAAAIVTFLSEILITGLFLGFLNYKKILFINYRAVLITVFCLVVAMVKIVFLNLETFSVLSLSLLCITIGIILYFTYSENIQILQHLKHHEEEKDPQ